MEKNIELLSEKSWSKKYKKSIDCNNPKGFSQKAHCAGRKKKESVMSSKLEELVGKPITEEQFDEAAGKKDACYRKVKARYDVWPSAYASGALVKCRKVGAANWGNKSKKEGVNEMDSPMYKITYQDSNGRKKTDIMRAKSNNLAKRDFTALNKGRGFKILSVVKEGLGDKFSKRLAKYNKKNKKSRDAMKKYAKVKKIKLKGRGVYQDYDGLDDSIHFESITENGMTTNHIYYEEDGKGYGYTLEFVNDLNEAEYQGRKVKLGKIMQGDAKKFKVYVKNPKGNVVKVNFGQGGKAKGGTMKIRKSNPKARANFRARHNCDNPGPRHKARYWSCRKW